VAVVAGSRQYIAPEQLLSQTASPATDIYALAIIVYEMVTGRLPFNPQGATHFLVMQELMRLQRSESFVEPRALRPDLPEAAQILLLNALSFDPGRRPQNARIFAEDLAQALMGKISAANARATIAVPSPAFGSAQGADGPPEREPPPATRIDTAENPIPVTDANVAARTSGPSSPRSQTAPVATGRETSAKLKGRKLPIIAGLIVVIAATAAIMAAITLWPSVRSNLNPGGAQSPTPQTATPSPATPEAERTFNYSFTVRRDPKKYPGGAPFQIPGDVVFAPGDRVHISFISQQRGYLYIINESPPVKGQDSSFNILFPTPTANQGSAQLAEGKIFRIPDHDIGFILDEEQGAEKLWLIWAASEVAELEPLKRWANPKDDGEIKDATEVKTLREFLAARSAAKPQVTQDDKQTTVKMKGDLLVKLVNLQHH
jgi:serine/threonine protein kinase